MIKSILAEREENGVFTSYYSFCKRCYGKDFNRRAIENLIRSGALDCFGLNRNQMLNMIDDILTQLDGEKKNKIDGQIGFFDLSATLAAAVEVKAPDIPEMSKKELLQGEKQTTGIYMSGHPIAEYMELSRSLYCARTSDITSSSLTDIDTPYHDGDKVQLLCILSTVRKKITKNNTTMAFLTLEDVYGSVECLVFPKMYDKIGQHLVEDNIVLLAGKVSLKDDEVPKLLCEGVTPENEIPDDALWVKNYRIPDRDYVVQKSAATVYESISGSDPDSESEVSVQETDIISTEPTDSVTHTPAVPASSPAAAVAEQKTVSQEDSKQQQPQKKAHKGVYLRVPSAASLECERAKKMCSIFNGPLPLVLFYDDTKAKDYGCGIATSADPALIKGLVRLLGEKNVVVRT